MRRVASLYLPNFAIDRLRRIDARTGAQPDRRSDRIPHQAPSLEWERPSARRAEPGTRIEDCSCPRGGGWRPGARWAKDEDKWLDRRIARKAAQRAALEAEVERLPAHQRPSMRELGRRSEQADVPFRKKAGHLKDHGRERLSGSAFFPIVDEEHVPLVTTGRDGQRIVLAATCPAAQALGLHPGMPLTQARAMVPGLDIRPADPEGDAADLDRLARHAARHWTPLVMVVPGEGLWLDIGASAHLFGGEERFGRRVLRLCRKLGLQARIAIAGTAAAASALARCAAEPLTICPPEEEEAALASLPLFALRLQPAVVDAARRLGIETVGALAAMPRAPLVRRFGAQIVTRLDEALGRAADPFDPVRLVEPVCVTLRFVEPIATAEAIEQVLGDLVAAFVTVLEQRGMAARRIALIATRVDGDEQRLEIGTAAPTRDVAHLLRLLLMQVEKIDPGFGIEAMRLLGGRVEPLGPMPIVGSLAGDPPAPDLAPLIDRLATRLGEKRIFRIAAVESDVPERASRLVYALALPDPWRDDWPRPARLLSHPERVENVVALLPDGAPRCFTWRGKSYRVARADGPERIHGEWWRRPAEAEAVRDYFQVEDETGARFWLYRRGDGLDPRTGDLSWHLQGLFG